jgi:hypothetical protein
MTVFFQNGADDIILSISMCGDTMFHRLGYILSLNTSQGAQPPEIPV